MIRASSRNVGAVMIAAIVVVLVVFLLITWLQGDSTDHLEEHQPSPSPAESSAPALGWVVS
ncbi:hypothetical protein ACT8ZV_18550 [Nocardioides sp. MAHUQ-72]|uniref:hypothetical protein n=1 Tax=unclassified Nocardioides TaxID=2615069 RepID=UPI003605ABE1